MTETDLGAHQGLVRCGRCREVFNASWNFVGSLPDAAADTESALSDQTLELPETPVVTQEIDLQDIDIEYDWDAAAPAEVGKAEHSLSVDEDTEPVAGGESERDHPQRRSEPKLPSPGDIAEEIVIEAPASLWDLNDDMEPGKSPAGEIFEASSGLAAAPVFSALQNKGAGAHSGEIPALQPRKITVSHKASDVKLVEIPHPKPMKSIAWIAATIFLVLAVLWQIKTSYLSELAEITSLRPSLETFCDYAACTVPARTDIKSIDLISTSVDPHPDTPGALRVSANLINRARFAQRFPPLEVTLTDKAGEVVGRRTYLPHEYLSAAPGAMQSNVIQRADLDLAQPAQTAVGYEIQLVAR